MVHARDTRAAGGVDRVQDLQRDEVSVRRRRVPALKGDLAIAGPLEHEIAAARDADLIVVGSREHGLLERLLHRPVEQTVAKRAGCDVLLVH